MRIHRQLSDKAKDVNNCMTGKDVLRVRVVWEQFLGRKKLFPNWEKQSRLLDEVAFELSHERW